MRYARAGGAWRTAFLEGGRLTFAALWWPVCPVKSCHVKTSYSSTLTGASLVSLLSMVEFFAIPQLPDCTPQSAKYSSFLPVYSRSRGQTTLLSCLHNTFFRILTKYIHTYYINHITLFWYVHSVCSRFEFQMVHLNQRATLDWTRIRNQGMC